MNQRAGIYAIVGLVILAILAFPILAFSQDIEVLIKGVDDGIKTNKQQDYQEALMNAKLQAIERAGLEITSITKIEDFQLKSDTVESKAKAVLLPGFQVMDLGYQADGTYLVILSGKVRTQEKGSPQFDAALVALKKTESTVKVGLNYDRYLQALPDMTLAVKFYSESPKADPEIVKLMKSASTHYLNAKFFWKEFHEESTKLVREIWNWEAIECFASAANARHYTKEQAVEICARQNGAKSLASYYRIDNVRTRNINRPIPGTSRVIVTLPLAPETPEGVCNAIFEKGIEKERPLCQVVFKFYPDLPDDRIYGWGMVGRSTTLSHIWSKASEDIEKLTKLKESSR